MVNAHLFVPRSGRERTGRTDCQCGDRRRPRGGERWDEPVRRGVVPAIPPARSVHSRRPRPSPATPPSIQRRSTSSSRCGIMGVFGGMLRLLDVGRERVDRAVVGRAQPPPPCRPPRRPGRRRSWSGRARLAAARRCGSSRTASGGSAARRESKRGRRGFLCEPATAAAARVIEASPTTIHARTGISGTLPSGTRRARQGRGFRTAASRRHATPQWLNRNSFEFSKAQNRSCRAFTGSGPRRARP